MAGIVIVFDFDRTIIDNDSDRWVVVEMGLTHFFNQLRPTLPWNSLMNRMMEELHSQEITTDEIAKCLERVPLHPQIIAAIKNAHSLGCDLKIISDANQFFIETILKHHELLACFSEINTNPTFVEEGRIRILPCHDLASSPHSCNLCPPNMCKGLIIERIRASTSENGQKRFIYLGDGKGDVCPSMKLGERDYVMPRKNFPLWNQISKDPTLIKGEVHDWSNGEDLKRILLQLIDKISVEDNVKAFDSNQLNSSDYNCTPTPTPTQKAFPPTLPVPH